MGIPYQYDRSLQAIHRLKSSGKIVHALAPGCSISLRGGRITSLCATIPWLLAIAALWSSITTLWSSIATLWSPITTLLIAALSTIELVSTDPTNQARRRAATMVIARRVLIIVSCRCRQKRIFDFPNGSLGSDREFEIFALQVQLVSAVTRTWTKRAYSNAVPIFVNHHDTKKHAECGEE